MLRTSDALLVRDRLREYGYKKLAEYYDSVRWRGYKELFRLRNTENQKCFVCSSPDFLQVHHTSYRSLCEEDMGHLCYACEKCHPLIHAMSFFNDFSILAATLCAREYFVLGKLDLLQAMVDDFNASALSLSPFEQADYFQASSAPSALAIPG